MLHLIRKFLIIHFGQMYHCYGSMVACWSKEMVSQQQVFTHRTHLLCISAGGDKV